MAVNENLHKQMVEADFAKMEARVIASFGNFGVSIREAEVALKRFGKAASRLEPTFYWRIKAGDYTWFMRIFRPVFYGRMYGMTDAYIMERWPVLGRVYLWAEIEELFV